MKLTLHVYKNKKFAFMADTAATLAFDVAKALVDQGFEVGANMFDYEDTWVAWFEFKYIDIENAKTFVMAMDDAAF